MLSHKAMKQLSGLGIKELETKVEDLRRELFGLRLSSSTTHIKDYSQFKKLRKNIARSLTLLGQKSQVDVQTTVAHKE